MVLVLSIEKWHLRSIMIMWPNNQMRQDSYCNYLQTWQCSKSMMSAEPQSSRPWWKLCCTLINLRQLWKSAGIAERCCCWCFQWVQNLHLMTKHDGLKFTSSYEQTNNFWFVLLLYHSNYYFNLAMKYWEYCWSQYACDVLFVILFDSQLLLND